MRNMSFSLTTAPMRNRTKDVTRRLRWLNLKPGQQVRAVEKCMGLKKGEKIKPISTIGIVSVRREPLNAITQAEVIREGFPHMTPADFVEMFCKANKCRPETTITRIEFSFQP